MPDLSTLPHAPADLADLEFTPEQMRAMGAAVVERAVAHIASLPSQPIRGDLDVAARGRAMRELHALWLERDRRDPYIGTLVNAWMAKGGRAKAVREGKAYVDTGTVGGYREAMALLEAAARLEGALGGGNGHYPTSRVVRVAAGSLAAVNGSAR